MGFVLPKLPEEKLSLARSGVRNMAADAPNSALERVFQIYGTVGEDKDNYFRCIYGQQ